MLNPQHLLRYGIRAYFLATSACVVLVCIIPALHKAFIPYGKTRPKTQPPGIFWPWLSDLTVPKRWFWHFYFLSIIMSIACGIQLTACSGGNHLCVLRPMVTVDGRTLLVLGMVLVQGCRRLNETLCVQKLSVTRMWIGHYLAGCAYYVMLNLAVIAEASMKPHNVTLMRSLWNTLDRNGVASVALFITSSVWQSRVHSTLASLRPTGSIEPTYSAPPPSNVSFQLFLTPHYTAEILIYLAMTLLARNWTMFTALVWVLTNLSVSAGETRSWVRAKFKENEWGKWNLVPVIY